MRSLPFAACLLVLVLVSACQKEKPDEPSTPVTPPPSQAVPKPEIKRIEATPEAVAKADEELEAAAARARKMGAALTFDQGTSHTFVDFAAAPSVVGLLNNDIPGDPLDTIQSWCAARVTATCRRRRASSVGGYSAAEASGTIT